MSSQSTTEHRTRLPAEALRVYLLGSPEVEWADHPLTIPRRQARALLYYLAVRLQPVPREQLCFLFWPDIPESTARRNLSHLLTHLRRALPDPDVLATTDDRVGLDWSHAWSDAAAFEQLCATPDAPRRAGTLQQATDLYRGPFLAGSSLPASPEFEAWVTQERRALERLYLEALASLIDEQTAQGEYDAAIASARRYLETDDLAEDIHRRVIELYTATGDRSAALRQFEHCAAALERELGVSPLPETRAVYENILAGRPPALRRLPSAPAWTTLPGLELPLIGRAKAVRQLEQAYRQARAGHGRAILISGEAGIGKSRLMQDFAMRLEDEALVLTGAGHPGAYAVPYHPVAQALRRLLDSGALDPWRTSPSAVDVQRAWLAEVSRLIPELRTVYPALPPPAAAEPDDARTRLFDALCQLTLTLAAGPCCVLLSFDDLHWADGTTLDWLAYLSTHLRHNRILLLGSYRREESDSLVRLRHALERDGVHNEIRLAGLDTAAVLQVLRHLGGPVPGDDMLAGRLQQATGGNPFFLLETLRVLLESGQPLANLARLKTLPLPDSVRKAVETRLERLSPVARQVVEAGAVLGGSFAFDLVRLTTGRRELETMDGLDELVARQLLVEQDAGYRFHHDLVRRAVGVGLSPVRRQLLSRRAGRALEQLSPDDVATVAYHFDAGGELKKALHYHGLAAQRAEALFAWREAEEHQGRMLELLDKLDPACSQPDCLARRGQILTDRAHLRFLQGRLAERDADLAALVELAEASGDAKLHVEALAHRVRYLNLDGQYAEAIATAQAGLALAGRTRDAAARSRFLAQIGFAHYFLGQPQPALTALESALEVTGNDADPLSRGRVTHILGYVHLHLGNYAQALACQQEAYTCHEAAGDHNRMAWDLTDMGILYTRLNRLPEAEEHLVKALELARKIGSQPAESYALNNLGTLHYVRGDYPTALQYHEESLVLQRATGSRRGEASALANSGMVRLALGDYQAAASLLRQATAIQEEIRFESGVAEGLAYLALAMAGLDRPDDALDAACRSLAVAKRIGDPHSQVAALNVLARLHLAAGEPEAALSEAGEAASLAEKVGLVSPHIFGLALAGLAHLALDDLEPALSHTSRAIALLEQHGCIQGRQENVYQAQHRVLLALGQGHAAQEALRRARAVVEARAGHLTDPEVRRRYLESALTDAWISGRTGGRSV